MKARKASVPVSQNHLGLDILMVMMFARHPASGFVESNRERAQKKGRTQEGPTPLL